MSGASSDVILTILMPTFNYLEGVERNINIISQCRSEILSKVRVVISDDSSDLEVKDKIQAIEKQHTFVVYNHGPQKGAINNWNLLLKNATTNYSMFIHHDEFFMSSIEIEKLIQHLLNYQADLLFLNLIKKKGTKLFYHYPSFLAGLFIRIPFLLYSCNPFGSPSVVVFSKNLSKIRFNDNLRWLVDVHWYNKLLNKSEFAKLCSDVIIISDLDFDGNLSKTYKLWELESKEIRFILSKKSYPFLMLIMYYIFIPLRIFVRICKLFRAKTFNYQSCHFIVFQLALVIHVLYI